MRRPECHDGVDPGVAGHPLHVVAGDQPAHRVSDQVDAFVTALGAHSFDLGAQPECDVAYVVDERAVVHRAHPAEAAAAQAAPEQGEHRAVVDDSVHQQDRRPCGLDVADDQPTVQRP